MRSNSSDRAPNKKRLDDYLRLVRERLSNASGPCPDDERLTAYFAKNLPKKEMEKTRDHVSVCDHCVARVHDMEKSRQESRQEKISDELIEADWRRFQGMIKKNSSVWWSLWRIAAAFFVALLAAGGGAYLTRPAHYSLARINAEVELSKLNTFRGGDPLALGIFALKNKNFKRANEIFINYASQNPDVFHGHYYAGVTLLLQAESGLVGRFRFRHANIEQAIGHLRTALSLLDNNPHQAANCYWFLGKAYLMNEEMALAKAEFQKILVISEAGIKRKQAAEQILIKMEN